MPLAERYGHWQQAADDELLDYDAEVQEPDPTAEAEDDNGASPEDVLQG